jgi:hypothetical protein
MIEADHSQRRHHLAVDLALNLRQPNNRNIKHPLVPTQQLRTKHVRKQKAIESDESG